jgi:hypothetical protein
VRGDPKAPEERQLLLADRLAVGACARHLAGTVQRGPVLGALLSEVDHATRHPLGGVKRTERRRCDVVDDSGAQVVDEVTGHEPRVEYLGKGQVVLGAGVRNQQQLLHAQLLVAA